MKPPLLAAVAAIALFVCRTSASDIVPGTLPPHWNQGTQDCATTQEPPLQVHAYNTQTFVLRQSLCATGEGNFLYLLVGSAQSLLIDTGDVAAAERMPLATRVLALMSQAGAAQRPLLVAHTHRHQDHRAGDGQFAALPNTKIIGYDLPSVIQNYGLPRWPEGTAHVDLGDRTLDVLPTPGHEGTHVVFYDRQTAILFTGDFLMPGRLTIEDAAQGLASARRLVDFFRDRPIAHVLGGHIERAESGELFPAKATHHPGERMLQLEKADVLALPSAFESFNGFYTTHGTFTLINPLRNLMAAVAVGLTCIATIVVGFLRYQRRRAKRPSRN